MTTAVPSLLGPSIMGTLVTCDLALVRDAYVEHLHLQVCEEGTVGKANASIWGSFALVDAPYCILANSLGEAWLRIVEDKEAVKPTPLKHTGWLSLEVLVADVDSLAASLEGSAFKVLRPVANLDMSDDIRAVQVKGPAGEVLYLTQIKAPVPPFELPTARCAVDHLFIPVLCSHDRRASLTFYEQIADHQGLSFDTKITVVNQAFGYDLDTKHPVATLQLSGETLIEIDQLSEATPRPCADGHLPAGIAMISFGIKQMQDLPVMMHHPEGVFYGRRHACVIKGPSGELVELIEA